MSPIRYFDYWPSQDMTDSKAKGLIVADFTGTSHRFTDEYKEWWQGLKDRGLLGDQPLKAALLPLPAGFSLADWWKAGFPPDVRKGVLDAAEQLPQLSHVWQPGATIAGYQVGKVLFKDDFKQKNDEWSFEGGVWEWQGGKLVQATTLPMVYAGAGWGGRAVMKDVADPRAGPILIEANGRVTAGAGYGVFGVSGGYIPGKPDSGLECAAHQGTLVAGSLTNWLLGGKAVTDLVHSWDDDFQFVLLLDGTHIKAKVWNYGSQPEPANWQFEGDVPAASLGSALMLHTESIAYWNNVSVWQLKK